MEQAGLDILIATSKHNVQYLLDAERAIFFDYMDALGISRYLPVLIYPKGAPEKAGYIGNPLEAHQRAVVPLWVPEVQNKSMGSVDSITRAVEMIRRSAGSGWSSPGRWEASMAMSFVRPASRIPGPAMTFANQVLASGRHVIWDGRPGLGRLRYPISHAVAVEM